VPRRILDLRERKDEEMDEENCIMRRLIMCILHQILLGRSNQRKWDAWGM
jgi:hypothetical protein